MSSIKSSMQMLNLGLSIFNKLQTMQHRQIRMARDLKRQSSKSNSNKNIVASDFLEADVTESQEFKLI